MGIRDLTPWNWGRHRPTATAPYDPFHLMHERMDRMFEDLFGPLVTADAVTPLAPRIDVVETDKEFRFTAELPGVDDKEVEVTLSEGMLTIKGEKKSETKEEKEGSVIRMERRFGSFQRSFSLPKNVDDTKVGATFDKGVLTVTVPKKEGAEAEVRKIEVKAA